MRWITVILLFCGFYAIPESALADSTPQEAPAGSAEARALEAAAPYLKNKEFLLRHDFWKGNVQGERGKAIRLQFFKGMTYRLFFAANAAEAERGTRLMVKVLDRHNQVVAESPKEVASGNVAFVEYTAGFTGPYLVLMRVVPEEKSDPTREITCVLYYGFQLAP